MAKSLVTQWCFLVCFFCVFDKAPCDPLVFSCLLFSGGVCVIPVADIRGVDSVNYSKGEKMLRCKLASLYRLADLHGWTQLIFNHISVSDNTRNRTWFFQKPRRKLNLWEHLRTTVWESEYHGMHKSKTRLEESFITPFHWV